MFKFDSLNIFKRERAEKIMEELLHEEFFHALAQDRKLTIQPWREHQMLTRVMHLDKRKQYLVVAERSPEGLLMLQQNEKVNVYTLPDEKHNVYYFTSKVKNILIDGDAILYEIPIPMRIKKGQRRNAYRLSPQVNYPIRLGDTRWHGNVGDISHNGIQIILKGYWPERVETGDIINDCHIELGASLSLACDVAVRYIQYDPYPGRQTRIGGKLLDLSVPEQRQLTTFITSRQRADQRSRAESRL